MVLGAIDIPLWNGLVQSTLLATLAISWFLPELTIEIAYCSLCSVLADYSLPLSYGVCALCLNFIVSSHAIHSFSFMLI